MKKKKSGILNLVSLYHLKLIIMFGRRRRVGFILFIVLMLLVQIRCQKARAMGRLWRN
jgi:hypothetical protein